MRRLHFALWTLGTVLALVLVVAAGSWLLVQRYGDAFTRERIEAGLAQALDRPVRVERVALRPWLLRVAVEGVAIADGPAWEDGTLAQARRTDIALSLASLWRLELVVNLVMRDVDVRYTAAPGGDPFLLPESIPDRIALGPVTVVVGSVSVEGARVRYVNRAAGWTADVEGLSARASPAQGGVDLTLDAGPARAIGDGIDESLERLRGSARLRGHELTLERLQARWRGEEITVEGRVRELAAGPRLALEVRGRARLAALAALAHVTQPISGVMAFDGVVEGRVADLRASGRVSIPELAAAGATARAVTARVAWAGGTLRLSEVKARALGGGVSGALVMTPARPNDSHVTARLDRVWLEAIEPLAGRALGVRGHVSAAGELRGNLLDLAAGEGAFHVESDDLVLPDPLARLGPGAVSGDVRLAGGGLDVSGLQARWPGLQARDVAGRITAEGPRGLGGTVEANVQPLAKAWGEERVAGRARVTATLDGRWDDLAARGDVRAAPLTVAGVTVSAVDAAYRLAGRTLTLSSLSATMDRSRIDGAATVAWSGPVDMARWREAVRFEARVAVPEAHLEDLHRWLPEEWRGTGRFTLTAGRAEGTPQAWRGSGRLSSPALTLRGERITDLTAEVTVDPARVQASGVRAVVRDIAVSGAGAWQWASASGRARLEAGPASLAALSGAGDRVAVEGTARASADLTFDGGAISGRASAAAQDVGVAGVRLGRGTIEAELVRSALTATVAFPDSRLSATAAGRLAAGQDIAVRAHVIDFDLAPLLARYTVPAAAGEVSGRVSGTADLLVPYSAPAAARGSLRLDPVRLRVAGEEWHNVGPLLLERRPGTTRVQAARLDSALGTVSATGAIDDAGAIDVAVQGRAALGALAALRPEIREAAGTLEVSVRATGTMSAPRLTGGGTLSGGRVVARDVPEPVTGIRGRFTLEGSRVRVTEAVATVSGGELRAGGTVDFAGPAPRLDLTLAGRLPLSALAALRPEVHEAAGVLEVDGRVSGTPAAPQASGEGTVRGGRVLLAAYPEALRDIQARFTVSPAGVRLARATASIGGGTVAAHGDLTLKGRQLGPFRFDVEARGVTAEPVAGARTTWDADLELLGGAAQALLRGEARLLRGAYVSDTPLLQLLVSLGGRGGGGGGPSLALPLQVRVRLDDNLLVRTAVTRFRAGGTVTLQGTLAAPVLFGAVEVREGQLIFRKQRFTITAASARFTDPRRIDPILDVQAQARIQAYDVTLRLTGRGENLEIRLASTPPLPEEDVLSLIAFGSTRQQLTRGGATAVAGEMAGLVLQDLFGLQSGEGGLGVDVEMETTEEDGRTVRLGRRLTDRTRVLYSQGIDRSDSRRLRLEYEVMGPFVIAGEQDFRGGFGGDVVLRLRFR